MNDYQSNSIERIKSDTLSGQLGLQYRLLPWLFWESTNQAGLTRRELDYDLYKGSQTEFNDLRFDQIE